jgi:TPR repeat protein
MATTKPGNVVSARGRAALGALLAAAFLLTGGAASWAADSQGTRTESPASFREAAERGDAEAQFKLGMAYLIGLGVKQDEAEAVKWFKKAAEQRYAEAQFVLGMMYEEGKGGVKQDEAEAVKWYRKAAEQGHAPAQSHLGMMYIRGGGIKQDEAEAVMWFRKAAEQGYADAQTQLGASYFLGKGVKQDQVEAVKWFRKAAEQGHTYAQAALRQLQDGTAGGADSKKTQKGLPVSIMAYGESYTISSFIITDGKNGNTAITCKGMGINAFPLNPSTARFVIPVGVSILARGVETEFESAYPDQDGATFIFDRKLDPDAVVFYPGDDKSKRTIVPVVR